MSFHFTSTHDMAAQLRDLADRMKAVPDAEIPRTLVELDIQVFGDETETSNALDAVDHLMSMLTNGREQAAELIRGDHYHYGLNGLDAAESAAPGDIPIRVVTVLAIDEFVEASLTNNSSVDVMA